MPEMEVEFEVLCECGTGLCGQTRTSHRRGMPQVVVDPCEKCLDRARSEGYQQRQNEEE